MLLIVKRGGKLTFLPIFKGDQLWFLNFWDYSVFSLQKTSQKIQRLYLFRQHNLLPSFPKCFNSFRVQLQILGPWRNKSISVVSVAPWMAGTALWTRAVAMACQGWGAKWACPCNCAELLTSGGQNMGERNLLKILHFNLSFWKFSTAPLILKIVALKLFWLLLLAKNYDFFFQLSFLSCLFKVDPSNGGDYSKKKNDFIEEEVS